MPQNRVSGGTPATVDQPTHIPPEQLNTLVRAEMVRTLFGRTGVILGSTIVNAAILVLALPGGSNAFGLVWISLVIVWSVARWFLGRAYAADEVADERSMKWAWWFAGSATGAGALWGAGGALFFSANDPITPVLLTFVIGGMAAGSAVANAVFLPAFAGFMTLSLTPLIVMFFTAGSTMHTAMGAMLTVFGGGVGWIGWETHRHLANTIRLRIERTHLATQLAETSSALRQANVSLEEQVAERTAALEAASRRAIETERELDRARRVESVGQLTGGIAHDFNNLLTIVLGHLQMLEEQVNDAGARNVRAARRAADRGAKLVRSLLAFARKEAMSPSHTELPELIRTLVQDVVRRTFPANIVIDFWPPDDIWPVFLDPVHLETALMNLLVNSRDAMPSGGAIVIGLENIPADDTPLFPAQDTVRLSLTDNGVGMSPDVLDHAFEPFFTSKGVGGGTGLGLSMVDGFAAQSGGHFRMTSREGVGTSAILYLPRARSAAVADAPATSIPTDTVRTLEGLTLLLVEDDEDVRRVAETWCRRAQLEVTSCASGDEAWALVQTSRYDLLFTDIMMPGLIDGIELARRTAARDPGLPILLTTGHDLVASRGKWSTWPVLKKPYGEDELIHSLSAVVNAPAAAAG